MLILILILLILLLPGPLLTFWNLGTLIFRKKRTARFEFLSFALGIFYMLLLYGIWQPRFWEESIVKPNDMSSLHEPLSREHILTILVLAAVGLAAYAVLRSRKERPPLAKVLAMAGVYIGIAVNLLFIIQLLGVLADNSVFMNALPFDVLLMLLVPFNYIVLAVVLLVETVREQGRKLEEEEISGGAEPYKSRFLNDCSRILEGSRRWALYALLLTLPLLCVIVVILLLFGQKPDSVIRAFTETADWTLSTKVPPPEVVVDAHYLCTVALRGHKKLVRPTRMGLRRGERIVVNRQLCVANAFEQLLEERTPRLHRAVRKLYDTYGYPVSRHIRTPLAADVAYLIMKPLEWLFVAALYLFDAKPEDRIARQYLPESCS